MWEPGYVTEVMGPRRYRVELLNVDQLWHRHQNQLCYCHVEDDDTRSAEISDSTGTSPITGDSLPVLPHHEESEDAETTASDSTQAINESSRATRCYPLWDCQPPNRYP